MIAFISKMRSRLSSPAIHRPLILSNLTGGELPVSLHKLWYYVDMIKLTCEFKLIPNQTQVAIIEHTLDVCRSV